MLYFIKKLLGSKDIPYRYDQIFDEVKRKKPKNIMEIGVWSGERARKMIKLASRFNSLQDINYFGLDLFETMDTVKYTQEVSKQPPKMEEIEKKLSLTGASIHLIKGDTTETLPLNVDKLPAMDIVFIDGGHSLETIANDWLYVSKLMHEKTVVIFDDYWKDRNDAGAKVTVDNIDRDIFSVELLPVVDNFINPSFGYLSIQLAKVTRR